MDNKVIGNKVQDNKDPKNQQKAQSSTQKGIVSNQKATYFKPQNSSPVTPNKGENGGVQVEEKRQKKVIRSMSSYTDGAIARAKALRGM